MRIVIIFTVTSDVEPCAPCVLCSSDVSSEACEREFFVLTTEHVFSVHSEQCAPFEHATFLQRFRVLRRRVIQDVIWLVRGRAGKVGVQAAAPGMNRCGKVQSGRVPNRSNTIHYD